MVSQLSQSPEEGVRHALADRVAQLSSLPAIDRLS